MIPAKNISYYRDAIRRHFIWPARSERESDRDTRKELPLASVKPWERGGPYPLFSATRMRLKERHGSRFEDYLFSPLYCGSRSLGYAPTEVISKWDPVTLADAVAISGSAVTPFAIDAPLTWPLPLAINVRLGRWVSTIALPGPDETQEEDSSPAGQNRDGTEACPEEPKASADGVCRRKKSILWRWRVANWLHRLVRRNATCISGFYLLRKWLYRVFWSQYFSDNRHLSSQSKRRCKEFNSQTCRGICRFHRPDCVFVADGGFRDFLGFEELLRRKCGLIILTDAGARAGSNDLSVLTQALDVAEKLCGVAFLDLDHEKPVDVSRLKMVDEKDACVAQPFCCFRVRYPAENGDGPQEGLVVYLQMALSGLESVAIEQIRNVHPNFPNESTFNQFFSRQQFEAYRLLGFHVAGMACCEIPPDAKRLLRTAKTGQEAAKTNMDEESAEEDKKQVPSLQLAHDMLRSRFRDAFVVACHRETTHATDDVDHGYLWYFGSHPALSEEDFSLLPEASDRSPSRRQQVRVELERQLQQPECLRLPDDVLEWACSLEARHRRRIPELLSDEAFVARVQGFEPNDMRQALAEQLAFADADYTARCWIKNYASDADLRRIIRESVMHLASKPLEQGVSPNHWFMIPGPLAVRAIACYELATAERLTSYDNFFQVAGSTQLIGTCHRLAQLSWPEPGCSVPGQGECLPDPSKLTTELSKCLIGLSHRVFRKHSCRSVALFAFCYLKSRYPLPPPRKGTSSDVPPQDREPAAALERHRFVRRLATRLIRTDEQGVARLLANWIDCSRLSPNRKSEREKQPSTTGAAASN